MIHGYKESTLDQKIKKVMRGLGLSKCSFVALLIVGIICTFYIALAGAKASKPKPVRA